MLTVELDKLGRVNLDFTTLPDQQQGISSTGFKNPEGSWNET